MPLCELKSTKSMPGDARRFVRKGLRLKERDLPLTALRAFAVAARSQNLASAAEQLGVTHGAVSKQIIALEAWLGQALFTREGRSLRLTPYGHVLADRVSSSIEHLGAACEYVRRDRAQKIVSVEAPTTFAMYFILPHIKEFEAKHPGLSVWISTRMTNQAPDFARHNVVITRGRTLGAAPRLVASTLIFEEELTIVSASSLLQRRPVAEPVDVLGHTLIASTSRPSDWDAWFARVGLPARPVEGGHHFDHLFVALHAVRDGIGSTIAPRLFFDRSEASYGLVCPLPTVSISGQPYFAHIANADDRNSVKHFIDWLAQKCAPQTGARNQPRPS